MMVDNGMECFPAGDGTAARCSALFDLRSEFIVLVMLESLGLRKRVLMGRGSRVLCCQISEAKTIRIDFWDALLALVFYQLMRGKWFF